MHLLLIEDDEAIAEAIGLLLEEEGHDVTTAHDGFVALEILRGGVRPDLVILDMMMPVMNGWEFRERQLADPALAAIPVVVCTADGRAEQKAAELGAAGWLGKPIDAERLLEVVSTFSSASRP